MEHRRGIIILDEIESTSKNVAVFPAVKRTGWKTKTTETKTGIRITTRWHNGKIVMVCVQTPRLEPPK